MNGKIACSIIVPVYNAERTLRRCVKSVTERLRTSSEILIINDGSTDETGKICQTLTVEDGRVRVIQQENGGVSSARNRGISEAVGDWILFLDADDQLEPGAVDYLLRYTGEKTDAVCGVVLRGNQRKPDRNEPEKILTDRHEFMDLALRAPTDLLTCHGWLIRRATIWENNILFSKKLKMGEDSEWMLRVMEQCRHVCIISTPVYRYSVSDVSAVHRCEKGKTEEYIRALETIRESEAGKEKNFPAFVLVNLLLILTHDTFHQQNKNGVSDQIRQAEALRDRPIIEEALKTADYSVLDPGKRFVLTCFRHRRMHAVRAAVKIRQMQNNLRAEKS